MLVGAKPEPPVHHRDGQGQGVTQVTTSRSFNGQLGWGIELPALMVGNPGLPPERIPAECLLSHDLNLLKRNPKLSRQDQDYQNRRWSARE